MKNAITHFYGIVVLISFLSIPCIAQFNSATVDKNTMAEATENLKKIQQLFVVIDDPQLNNEIASIRNNHGINVYLQFSMRDDGTLWTYLFNLYARIKVEDQIAKQPDNPYLILIFYLDYEGECMKATKFNPTLTYELSAGLAKFDNQIREVLDVVKGLIENTGYDTQKSDEFKEVTLKGLEDINDLFNKTLNYLADIPSIVKVALAELKDLKLKEIEKTKKEIDSNYSVIKEQYEDINNLSDTSDALILVDYDITYLGSSYEGEMTNEETTEVLENSNEVSNYFKRWQQFNVEELVLIYLYAIILEISEYDTDAEIEQLSNELKMSAKEEAKTILLMIKDRKSLDEIKDSVKKYLLMIFDDKINNASSE